MTECPLCNKCNGDDWSQCPKDYTCPKEASPWYINKKPFCKNMNSETLKDPTLKVLPDSSSNIKMKFWACHKCVGSCVTWEGDLATCKECGRTNAKATTIREALLDMLMNRAVPYEYYHDYYFSNGKISDDCPSREKLLEIIQDQCSGINDDVSHILDMLNND